MARGMRHVVFGTGDVVRSSDRACGVPRSFVMGAQTSDVRHQMSTWNEASDIYEWRSHMCTTPSSELLPPHKIRALQ